MEWMIYEGLINFSEMFISCFLAAGIFHHKTNETRGRKNTYALVMYAALGAVFMMLREHLLTWIPDIVPAVVVFALFSVAVCKAKWWAAVTWALINYLFIGIFSTTSDYAIRMFLSPVFGADNTLRARWLLACVITRIAQLLLSELILLVWKRFPASSADRRGNWKIAVVSFVSIIVIWFLWVGRFNADREVLYSNTLVCLLVLVVNFLFLFFDEVIAGEKQVEEELRTQNLLAALQIRNQDEVNNMYKNILSLKHDINNHLHTISGYMQVGEYEKARDYVEKIAGEVSGVKSFHSGNTVIDALIGSKTALAKMNDIPVETDLSLPSELKISDDHLTVMIGNLYDNAIDANLMIDNPDKRFIRIRITYDGGNLMILFENAAAEEKRVENGGEWTTTKEDASMHGFGIKNIDKIVQMYGGYCERKLENHVFSCRIRLSEN